MIETPRFEDTYAYRVGRIFKDGIIYVSDVTGQPLIYIRTDGVDEKLLDTDRAMTYTLDRENNVIFATHDEKGDERWIISVIKHGEEEYRIGGDKSINHIGWPDPETKQVPYTSNREEPSQFKLYIMDYEDYTEREIYGPERGLYGSTISPGGELVAVQIYRSSSDVELRIIESDSGREVSGIGGGGDVVHLPRWVDDDTLMVITDVGRENLYLARYRVGGELEPVVEAEWDVENYAYQDGILIHSVNEAGDSKLYINGDPLEKPKGVVNMIDIYNGKVLISMDTIKYGESIWTLEDGRLKPYLYAEIFDELTEHLVEPEVVRYRSWDELNIDMILYKPKGKPPYPTIINPHGGPESQSRPRYSPLIQKLIYLGYAVAQPNYRGGTGYGKTFRDMDRVEKRVDSLRDVEKAIYTLIERRLADPNKIGIMGGSYGGYVTLYMITHLPKRFKAAVSIVGIANLETFLRNTGPWRRRHREYKYGSLERDIDILRRLSPIHYIENVETPLLLIHGANDPRVPVEESIMMYNKLAEKGVETELVIYDDEGHGVVKKANRLDYMDRIVKWFLKHIPP